MNYRTLIALVAAVAVLGGCASAGNEKLKDMTRASVQDTIVEGKTTKAKVKEVLGEATSVAFTDGGGEMWTYRYSRATPQAKNFIPVVNIFSRGVDVQNKEIVVLFDKNEVVSRYTMRETSDVVKRGLAE
jgi:outer membrane protein assembly factor BamE (lipoprotein component of BamABCDE complex)